MSEEDGFSKFEKLAEAIKIEQEQINELIYSFEDKICPFGKEKCKGRECSWYMICVYLNRKAYHDFIS
ncbi:MAG: hypothetical protein ACTSRZ_07625 [Promethearchaeota archaeon]